MVVTKVATKVAMQAALLVAQMADVMVDQKEFAWVFQRGCRLVWSLADRSDMR